MNMKLMPADSRPREKLLQRGPGGRERQDVRAASPSGNRVTPTGVQTGFDRFQSCGFPSGYLRVNGPVLAASDRLAQ